MTVPNGVINIASVDAFNRLVNSYKDNLILVDFYTDWCAPCKAFYPIYEKIQRIYYSKGVLFTRINSEHFPEVSQQFGIQGVPSLMIIRNKKGLKRHTGALNGHQLQQLIDSYL